MRFDLPNRFLGSHTEGDPLEFEGSIGGHEPAPAVLVDSPPRPPEHDVGTAARYGMDRDRQAGQRRPFRPELPPQPVGSSDGDEVASLGPDLRDGRLALVRFLRVVDDRPFAVEAGLDESPAEPDLGGRRPGVGRPVNVRFSHVESVSFLFVVRILKRP